MIFLSQRTGSNQVLWAAIISLGIGHAIAAGSLLMLGLEARRLHMPLVHI
jgi:hypothetical protein